MQSLNMRETGLHAERRLQGGQGGRELDEVGVEFADLAEAGDAPLCECVLHVRGGVSMR